MVLSIQSNVSALEAETKSYIHGITLATFLQLMNAEQKNCTLKVISANQTGYLYIRRGELLDAKFADLSGEAAALEIVTWENAEIEMDATCRRNQVVISRSIEYILIAAFQRKDEQLHQTRLTPQNSKKNPTTKLSEHYPAEIQNCDLSKIDPTMDEGKLTQDEIRRERLLKILHEHNEIMEYVIFDRQGFLKEKNPGKCSIAAFDPNNFTHLIKQLDSQLNFGSCNFLSFSRISRYRCLFFHCQQQRILLKLQPGSQPQMVVKEIKSNVNC